MILNSIIGILLCLAALVVLRVFQHRQANSVALAADTVEARFDVGALARLAHQLALGGLDVHLAATQVVDTCVSPGAQAVSEPDRHRLIYLVSEGVHQLQQQGT